MAGRALGLILGLALVPGAALADCRLALLLGLDISSSVDAAEDALQRQGLARALAAPQVRAAILAQPGEPVALAVFEWSGRYQQELILDWSLLDSPAAIDRAAARIAGSTRSYGEFPTAMGYAIGHAAGLLARAPACLFSTLDLSGDGPNNDGFGPDRAYRHFPLAGVTVNGLAIDGKGSEVSDYYRRQVLHGPGAFLEIARGFEDFERAMTRKLLREVGTRILGAAP